jgi:hypothetical protein
MEPLVFCLCLSSPFTEAVSVKLIIISTAKPESNVVDCKKERKKIDLSLMSAFLHLLTLLQQKEKCLSL